MKNKKLFAILTLVCFMFTLMPVAAFAADGDPVWDASAVYTVDADASANVGEDVELEFSLLDKDGVPAETDATVFVWATVGGSSAASSALEAGTQKDANAVSSGLDNILKFEGVAHGEKVVVKFARANDYTIHAAMGTVTVEADKTVKAPESLKTEAGRNIVDVDDASVNPDTKYAVTVNGVSNDVDTKVVELTGALTPNNVANEFSAKFTMTDADNKVKPLTGKTIQIDCDAALSVNKTQASPSTAGEIKFNVAASREGEYNIYLTVDGVTFTVKVLVSNTSAAYIETIYAPANPQALWDGLPLVRFQVTDINGNIVVGTNSGWVAENQGMNGIKYNAIGNSKLSVEKGTYIVLTEKPAASKLESKDFRLKWNANKQAYELNCAEIMDAEGTYAVKVILDNGATATASWEVKQFQTPVQLRIDYNRTTVELGATIAPTQIVYVDANGVEKQAKTEVQFAATGYAVYELGANGNARAITVKTDEKYVGSKINVTAVSDRYNYLVANVELTVADGAKDIVFADKVADVNVNNKITWNVVDSQGNKVALGEGVKVDTIKYVVLDKPEDARVSIYDASIEADVENKGEGKMSLTSSKIGNVTVQVIVKAEYTVEGAKAEKVQTKYYTGTEVFAVGTEGTGDVVVMSIGSTEIVINDVVSDMGVAPIIENGRTFVPYRAGLEALGATVAYDEAAQAVTAEMNGVTVVMTIGSNVYTVNGVENTMDVAPFIVDGRTMVPARFAAQAFGITVIPTQNPDGTTADVLYIM